MFRDLPDHLPDDVSVAAVLLPGRENRIAERPYDRMGPLVEALAEALGPTLVVSACSGHGFKFGALIGERIAETVASGADPAPFIRWAAGY